MFAMHNYHLYHIGIVIILHVIASKLGEHGMRSLLKSSVLGLGLLAGVSATASAQSVSALPPAGAAPVVTAPPPVTSSTQTFYPKPGGNSVWQEEHYQPPAGYAADKSQHPYS